MNEYALIYLILAIIFLFIIFSIILYNILHGPINNNNNNNNTFKKCTRNTDDMINIKGITNCYDVNNNITPYKYVCPSNNFPLFATLSNVEIPYLTACSGYCSSGNFINNVCADTDNQLYNTCINLTKPINCNTLAMPVAYDSNNVYYYINYAGSGICVNSNCQQNIQ